ncbi:MAG: ABC transporter ATP-binding protein [Nitrosomonas sp.]|nr:ABC transporter ATP-binding protein [Nitrosomonas sp.]
MSDKDTMNQERDDIAIRVSNLSKCYQIYDTPRDRLKQFILPRIQHAVGRQPTQYFREFWALKDVSFEVKKGETVGIIGRNGSGKSTLLQMICGTLNPTTGSITTHGRIAALLELGSGFNPEFTGRENVYMNASVLGLSKEEIDHCFDDIAAFAEIDDFMEQPVRIYSSGMYARLAFSIAIFVDPKILVVDEALAVGDSRFVAKCMRRIKDMQGQGMTILFVSHDVSSVRTLCQQAIWLNKGQIVENGEVFPVTGKYVEFMFKDELLEENEIKEKYIIDHSDANMSKNSEGDQLTISDLLLTENQLDIRPVIHWGSHKGIILGASVCDEKGIRKDVVEWSKSIKIIVDLLVPLDIPREYLSVAFSIKDLKGTDLIVSTTNDYAKIILPEQERFSVSFHMINPLVTGKYLLVVAVENRQYRDIHYYEYFEGAHYFMSLANERFFGIFQPAIEQYVTTV